MAKSQFAVALLLAGLTGACGDGGAAGELGSAASSTPPPISTPAPTPTPTPTPSTPPAPFGLSSSQSFEPFGWVYGSGTQPPEIATNNTVALAWSQSLGTYQLTLPQLGSGTLAYTYPGTPNRTDFDLIGANATKLPVHVNLQAGPLASQSFSLSSVGTLGWWRQDATTATGLVRGVHAFGITSTSGAIPQSGIVKYETQGQQALLTFDFGAASFGGSVGLAWDDDWGPYPVQRYTLARTNYARGAVEFSASFTVEGAPFDGIVRGRFYGPGAQELALAWSGPVKNPYSQDWVRSLGVWLGRACTQC